MKSPVLLLVAVAVALLADHAALAVPTAAPDALKLGAGVDAAATCSDVSGYFEARNLSTPIPDSPVDGAQLQVCASSRSCCTPAMEAALRRRVHRDFAALVHHNSRSTQDVLATASASLRDHLVRLSRWSEAKTLALFAQVYQRMAVLARDPIRMLYADIVRYLDAPAQVQGAADAAWLSSPPQGPSMTDSVNTFFAKLFPLTFHTSAAPIKRGGAPQRQLEPTYERCLSSRMAEVQPFGEAPRALAHSLGRALEAARVLLGVLRIGADVLNATDSMLIDDPASGSACPTVLLRLWACPWCAGIGEAAAVRPCQGYCLNVLRGCVTERTSELDQPWASFVEAAAKLAGSAAAAPDFPGRPRDTASTAPYQLNAEEAIRQMENKISEAIMFAMEHGPAVERKMKSACGPPKWVEVAVDAAPSTSTPWPYWGRNPYPLGDDVLGIGGDGPLGSPASPASAVHFAKTLRELQESLLRSRSFYADLADVLCADEGFAAKNSQPCWNGQRVGEYTKTVVAASASAQRYNPELPWGAGAGAGQGSPIPAASIPHLGDQLRHLRQLVLSQMAELATAPESDSFVRDEEGYEVAEGSAAGGASGAARPGHYPAGGGAWSDDEDHDGWHVPSELGSGQEGSGDEGPPVDANNVDASSNWTADGASKPPSTPGRGGAESGKDKASAAAAGHLQLSVGAVVLGLLSTRVLRLATL